MTTIRQNFRLCVVSMLMLLISSSGVSAAGSSLLTGKQASYRADMVRLAEVLGAVHLLRERCGGREGQMWRRKMLEMLDIEASSKKDRDMLVNHFNKSYYAMRVNHSRCSMRTISEMNAYIDEGAAVAGRLARAARQ
ncbi:MAG: TIGR02301 family protein [Parvibaculaceae bacterium]|nr:TIGR02301 family protein [Parvibaculaceae bacterium]